MQETLVRVKVDLGTTSCGKETTSIGFRFSDDSVEPEQVRSLLCKRRVACTLELVKSTDVDGQQQFDEVKTVLEGSADTGRISMGLDDYSGRLQFSLADHAPDVLLPFRNREGWLRIHQSGHIPEKQKANAQ